MEFLNKTKQLIGKMPTRVGALSRGTSLFKRTFIFCLLSFLMLFALSNESLARNYFVTEIGPGKADNIHGNTWDEAIFLSTAMANAVSGDIIYVRANVDGKFYQPSITLNIKSGVKMYGGYSQDLTGTDTSIRDPKTNVTTIKRTGSDDGSVIIMEAGTAQAITLVDGFEITGGRITGDGIGLGVKIADYATLSNSKIYENSIVSNYSISATALHCGGAGVSLNGEYAKLLNCTVEKNTTSDADCAGVFLIKGLVKDCTISENETGRRGGGIYALAGSIEGCYIEKNKSKTNDGGGGVYINPNVVVKDCIISGNTAEFSGGGVYAAGGRIEGCCIYSNTSVKRGAGIYISNVNVVVENCDVRGNNVTGDYCGGIFITDIGSDQKRVKIINTIVANNQSNRHATGIYSENGWVEVLNCTIVNNNGGGESGNGVYSGKGKNIYIQNSIIWGNSGATNESQVVNCTVASCAIQGTPKTTVDGLVVLSEENNNAKGPKFTKPTIELGLSASVEAIQAAVWDIDSLSPCVGVGLKGEKTPEKDISGVLRHTGDSPEGPTIGAYEKLPGGLKVVNSLAEFNLMSAMPGAYQLGADIILDNTYTPIDFSGSLDGNQKKIILNKDIKTGGIFNTIGYASNFENLTIKLDSNISNVGGSAGAFIGVLDVPATFKNVKVIISSDHSIASAGGNAGGFVGTLSATGVLKSCSVVLESGANIGASNPTDILNVKKDNHVGGLIGRFESVTGSLTINESFVHISKGAQIASTSTAHRRTGGLLGWINSEIPVDISNCALVNEGTLGSIEKAPTKSEENYLGGFVTHAYGTTKISNSIVYNAKGGKMLTANTDNVQYGVFASKGISPTNVSGCTFVTGNYLVDSQHLPNGAIGGGTASTMATLDLSKSFVLSKDQKINLFKDEKREKQNFLVDVSMFGLKKNDYAVLEQIFLKGIKTPEQAQTLNLELIVGSEKLLVPFNITPSSGTAGSVMYIVPGNTDPTFDGRSWEKAWGRARVQEALNTLGTSGGGVLNVALEGKSAYGTSEQTNTGSSIPYFTVPAGVVVVGGWNNGLLTDVKSKFTNTSTPKKRVFILEAGAEIQNLEVSGGDITEEKEAGAGVLAKEFSRIIKCKIHNNTQHSVVGDALECRGAGVMMGFGSVIEESEVSGNTATNNGVVSAYGAGIYIDGSNVIVNGCTISGNKLLKNGGNNYGACGAGIFIAKAATNVIVKKSKILSNSTELTAGPMLFTTEGHGGGFYIEGSNNIIEDCMIANNKAGGNGSVPPVSTNSGVLGQQYGGGLCVLGNNNTIRNNKIYGNYSNNSGGGIFINGTNTLLYNNVIAYNHAQGGESVGGDGGGIYCKEGATNTRIYNTTVVRNSSANGTSVYGSGTTKTIFDNSIAGMGYAGKIGSTNITGKNLVRVKGSNILYFNDNTVGTTSDMKPNTSDAISNAAKDNTSDDGSDQNWFKFKNNVDLTPAADYTEYLVRLLEADFSVMPGSPCVDKGKVISDIPALDINGQDRPLGRTWDIGAYEMEPAIIIASIDYVKSATGEDVLITAKLSEPNPIGQAVGIDLTYISGAEYLLSAPTKILFPSGSQTASIRLRFKMIDKNVTLSFNMKPNSEYVTFGQSISSSGSIALNVPVFAHDKYPVDIILRPATLSEGEAFEASISLKDPNKKPPMRMGIELKPQSDAEAFLFPVVADSRILWIDYGATTSNKIIVKTVKRLGNQYGTNGRQIKIEQDIKTDHSFSRMTCEPKQITVKDVPEDDTMKVSGKLLPVSGNFFTNEKVEINIKLDSKLISTEPLFFDLTISPEIESAKGAQIKIDPQTNVGSYVLTIPNVFKRQDVTVTANPTAGQATWISKLDPESITFKAGNSIYYVDASKVISGDGSSWANAFNKIEEAYKKINDATDGDEIRIAGGTYTLPSVLEIKGWTRLSGSWDPKTDLRDVGNAEYVWNFQNQTIINGEVSHRMFAIADSGLVDGVKIVGGMGITLAGKGVLRNSEISNITLEPTTPSDVSSVLAPIQIVDRASTNALIEDCYIHDNKITSTSLESAGAIATKVAGLNVSRCIIGNNKATKGAGALLGNLTLMNALIVHNESENVGAFESASADIRQSTFVRNKGKIIVGGIVGAMQSSIIWGNSSSEGKPINMSEYVTYSGIDYTFSGIDRSRNIIRLSTQNNEPETQGNVPPKFSGPNSNLAGNIVNMESISALGNWHLTTELVNMGSPNVKGADLIDLAHQKRVQNDVIDLGCYESGEKGKLTVTFTLSDYEYTGKDIARDGKVAPVIYKVAFPMEGRVIPLKFKKTETNVTLDSPLDVGTYQVIADDPNWVITPQYASGSNENFTISQRPISVTVDNKDVIIKSPLPTFTYTLSSGVEEPRDAGKILEMSVPQYATNTVGEYPITGVAVKGGNYLINVIQPGVLTVKKQRITADNIEWIYPGGSDRIYYNGQPRRCTVSFKQLTLAPSSNQYEVVDNSPKFPGKYTAFVRLTPGASEIFDLESSAMIEYQIHKVDIELTGTIIHKTYGDEDPVYTCSTSPALFASDRLVTTGTVRVPGENVGSYSIPTDTWSHIGYNVTKRGICQLAIAPAPLTVTPNPVTHSVKIPLDSSMFSTTIIGFKRKDTLSEVYENMPKCWPVTLDSVVSSTVEVQVDPTTLQPNGKDKSLNYTATSERGTIYYTAESNQTLDFKTIPALEYGASATMTTTSNKGSNLSFTYESSNPAVLTVIDGNRIVAKGVGLATITVKQAGVSTAQIDAAQLSQLVTVNAKTIIPTIPINTYEYDEDVKTYDTKLVTFQGVLSTDKLSYEVTQDNNISTPGQYDVKVILHDLRYSFSGNQITVKNKSLVITKAVVTFKTPAPRETYTYKADSHYFTGKIEISLPSAKTTLYLFVDSVYSARDVGDHPVSIRVSPKEALYTGSEVFDAKIRIEPATLKVDFKDTEYVKALNAVLPTLQKDDFVYTTLLGTDTVVNAPAYTTAASSQTVIGEYRMTLDTKRFKLNVKKTNYVFTAPTKVVNLKIVEKALSLDDCNISGLIHTFDGNIKKITLTPQIAGTFLETDVKYEYKRDDSTIESPIEPGRYTVAIKIGTQSLGTVEMTINKASLLITYGETHFTYDAAIKPVTFTVKPLLTSDIYFEKHIKEFTYRTTYNGSENAPSAIGVYRVQTSINSNPFYDVTASVNMTIARLPAQIIGFTAIGATVTEPTKEGEVVHMITVKSADGKPVRGGLFVGVNAVGSLSTKNYTIEPKRLDFKGDSTVSFKVIIFNKDQDLAYNDQELIFTLASTTDELRVDGLLQYTLKIKNIDLAPSTPRAQFYYSPSTPIREGESVSVLITSSSSLGNATVQIRPSSKDLKFKIHHGSNVYDQTHKEIKVGLDGEGSAQLSVAVERSYTATDKNSTIRLNLAKVLRADGSKDMINGEHDVFGVDITPLNPFLAPVALSKKYSSLRMATFDLMPFIRQVYTDSPVIGVQLSPVQFVESITTNKGAIVSVIDQQLAYAYGALTIKNPEIGFEDQFTAYLSDGFGGMTRFDATVSISESYTYGSTYALKPNDFENPYGFKSFTKTPSLTGRFINPFTTVKPGRTVNLSKASMKTRMTKDKISKVADSALIEVSSKIKLVNASNLKKLRAGKLLKSSKPNVYYPSVRYLETQTNYPQVVVSSIGIALTGKGDCAKDNKKGDPIGAIIISHPVVTDSAKAVGIGYLDQKGVIVVTGDFFGSKPVGYLEYRKANGTIITTKLKMITSSKTKAYQARSPSTITYTAPTKDEMKQNATRKSTLMFYMPKSLSALHGERVDLLIDSGSGISGVESFIIY